MKAARFNMLARSKPQEHERLMALGQNDIDVRWQLYEQLAAVTRGQAAEGEGGNGANKAQTTKEVDA
jgi:hypothetical protein